MDYGTWHLFAMAMAMLGCLVWADESFPYELAGGGIFIIARLPN